MATRKQTKLTQDLINQSIDLYKNKQLNFRKTSEITGLSQSCLYNLMVKNNVEIRSKKKLTTDNENQLLIDYQNGMSRNKCSKKYGISSSVVLDYLKSNNITYRNPPARIYNVNETIFDNLEKPEILWVLGWLWSDGNVGERNFGITIHRNDELLLNKFLNIMGVPDVTIYRSKRSNCSCTRISSKYLCEKLVKLGCIKNKSLVVRYPSWIKKQEFHWPFLRGLFEGDGSYNIKNKNGAASYCELSSGSIKLAQKTKEIIEKYLNISVKIISIKNKYYRIIIQNGTKDILKFLDKLYENSTPETRLDRKYNNYLEIKRRYELKY